MKRHGLLETAAWSLVGGVFVILVLVTVINLGDGNLLVAALLGALALGLGRLIGRAL